MTMDFIKHRDARNRWVLTGLMGTLIVVLIIPFSYYRSVTLNQNDSSRALILSPEFVGRDKCKECHRNEYDRWKNSHHDKAMDMADNTSVLGDFNNAEFSSQGIRYRFFKKEDAFFVHTIGPDGKYADFQITHTFGFTPLQQYLVPFDKGLLQCLTIAWDDEKKRWYALPNHTDNPDDWLHWTRQGQNWNSMCAECHSTNLKKGYNNETGQYNTTWSEIDVSCEACHGPGSDHVSWAEIPEMGRPRVKDYNLVVKTREISPDEFIGICARCHSSRSLLGDFSHGNKNLMDSMIPNLLTEALYYPDGQILEEVYVYGSFMQSKMFLRDVKCNDCHDVHSLELKSKGNALCLNCHRANIYDTKDHHFHKKIHEGKESKGGDCIQCHMPERLYMGIDKRADHSIRIPRPDLSLTYQTPNACNAAGCHDDKTLEWTNKFMIQWYGIKKRPHFGQILARGRQETPDAVKDLIHLSKEILLPGIVRATALSLLSSYPVKESYQALESALSDPDPLVRQTAIATINLLQFDKNATLVFPLLYDPVKAVRIQAALGVASLKNLKLSDEQIKILNHGINEYISAMEYVSDFPSGRYNIGLIYQAMGETDRAVESYKMAIQIDDLFFPAKNNLAMLYNDKGENQKAEILFKQILENRPDMYEIAYSLGLLLVEQKKYSDAVVYLEQAAGGLPDRARIHYNLGLLQQFLKMEKSAEESLLKALALNSESFDFLYALANYYIKQGHLRNARLLSDEMIRLYPQNRAGYQILNHVRKMEQLLNVR